MSEYAISARGLSKAYRLGELTGVGSFILKLVRRGGGPQTSARLMALDGISFEIERGDCVGILGSNGSGKSTLVQTIASIAVPTGGELRVRGRVLPLLEIGAGFHSELTGRENVVLFGTVLGLDKTTITRSMKDIAAFGEIDEWHMSTPIKRFSIGMQARLSFAVAIRFPADIYIFDEVMAVVDDHFRGMAVREIRRLHESGKTVIVISHDLDLVKDLCTSGMWLDEGKLRAQGGIAEVAAAYHEFQVAGLDEEEALAARL
jgi:ABC-type polysaccharide/polyol phosphate transport system ATPase subunit